MTDQELLDMRNLQKRVGDAGENFVLKHELKRLCGHPLIEDVGIVGREDLGLGYDIISFDSAELGSAIRYIEVKTYSGKPHFFLSQGEWSAAEKYGVQYYLYLVDVSRIEEQGYEPVKIQNPISALSDSPAWNQKVQTREFEFVGDSADLLPEGFDDATILLGCFNDNRHLKWILSRHCYNVRAQVGESRVPGAVKADELTLSPKYLILYYVGNPRTYSVYEISASVVAAAYQLKSMGYGNPRCPHYLLYKLVRKIEIGNVDIMQVLRTCNDKRVRTSGTPIYMSGNQLRRYMLNSYALDGRSAPLRSYTNIGKPWTKVNTVQLLDLHALGRSIPEICHSMKRSPDEVKEHLRARGVDVR